MGEDVKAKFAEWNYRFNPWCTRRAAECLAGQVRVIPPDVERAARAVARPGTHWTEWLPEAEAAVRSEAVAVPVDVYDLLVEGFGWAGDGQADPFTREDRDRVDAFVDAVGRHES